MRKGLTQGLRAVNMSVKQAEALLSRPSETLRSTRLSWRVSEASKKSNAQREREIEENFDHKLALTSTGFQSHDSRFDSSHVRTV